MRSAIPNRIYKLRLYGVRAVPPHAVLTPLQSAGISTPLIKFRPLEFNQADLITQLQIFYVFSVSCPFLYRSRTQHRDVEILTA